MIDARYNPWWEVYFHDYYFVPATASLVCSSHEERKFDRELFDSILMIPNNLRHFQCRVGLSHTASQDHDCRNEVWEEDLHV